MKVIIAGSRTVTDIKHVEEAMFKFIYKHEAVVTLVISGRAQGSDLLGELWALGADVEVSLYPADWATYGKAAGAIRNEQMCREADALVAIWDGISSGTADMIRRAKKKGIPVYIHYV